MIRRLFEVCEDFGLEERVIIHYIEEEWVSPVDSEQKMLDEEDIARIRLIKDLIDDFGVNEEAVPIILHLIDQINVLQTHIKESKNCPT